MSDPTKGILTYIAGGILALVAIIALGWQALAMARPDFPPAPVSTAEATAILGAALAVIGIRRSMPTKIAEMAPTNPDGSNANSSSSAPPDLAMQAADLIRLYDQLKVMGVKGTESARAAALADLLKEPPKEPAK